MSNDDPDPHPLVRLGESIGDNLVLAMQPAWDLIELLASKGVISAEEAQRLADRHDERVEEAEREMIARQAARRRSRG